MNYLKSVPISNLKAQYSEHHGFVFLSNVPIAEGSVGKLVEELKKQAIITKDPILVTRIDNGFAFVFEEFDGPMFYRVAGFASHLFSAEIYPLCFYLQGKK